MKTSLIGTRLWEHTILIMLLQSLKILKVNCISVDSELILLPPVPALTGGSRNMILKEMKIDSNDNIYIVGMVYNSTPPDSSNDWWIKKFNSSGTEDTVNWNTTFTSSGRNTDDALNVALDPNNNVYIAGTAFNITGTEKNYWLLKKYNGSGTEDTTNWNKTFNT